MRLESVRIQNFRSFHDATVEFGDYTCLVGPNGSGKSNVLRALNIFFGDAQSAGLDPSTLTEEDFHNRNTDEPVRITLTFSDLEDEAQKDFAHYFRQGKLIVSAVAEFDPTSGLAVVRQYGQRMGIEEFRRYFEAEKGREPVQRLREIYEELRRKFSELPVAKSKEAMRDALLKYEEAHPDKCRAIPSEDQFYGVSKGRNLLEKYVQWVYVPAVKEVSSEEREGRDTFLGKLLERTVRGRLSFDDDLASIRNEAEEAYQRLLAARQDVLRSVSEKLTQRIKLWAHPDARVSLRWEESGRAAVEIADPRARAVLAEGSFEGAVARFGHGLQRAYLLALLQELSEGEDDRAPTLILACEEPELYQHPPQARHLYEVLSKLSKGNAQVVVSTHSPWFISGERFESIRLVRKVQGASIVHKADAVQVARELQRARPSQRVRPLQGVIAKLHQTLRPQVSEMFFAPNVILVEGIEDVAYIATHMLLAGMWDEYRRLGCHLVPVGRKSAMIRPLAVANSLQIPAFAVFDADKDQAGNDPTEGKYKAHWSDNIAILTLCGVEDPQPFPDETQWHRRCVVWPTSIEDVVAADIGEANWEQCRAQADMEFGHSAGLRKNPLHIARSLEIAWECGHRSASLQRLCEEILSFARSNVA